VSQLQTIEKLCHLADQCKDWRVKAQIHQQIWELAIQRDQDKIKQAIKPAD
jgi:hypothetical protein